MTARVSRRLLWGGAIILAYTGLVVIAYAIGPQTTSGCSVVGHGQVTVAGGDQASFRGLSATPPARGGVFYRDNGPTRPFRLISQRIDTMTCSNAASSATITGRASIVGAGAVEFRVDIQLNAVQHGQDTYRLRLGDGYDSGAGQIHHGDLDIHAAAAERHHRDSDAAQNPAGAQDGG